MGKDRPCDRVVRRDQFGLQSEVVVSNQAQRLTKHDCKSYFRDVSLAAQDHKNVINMLSDRVLVQIPRAEGERTSRSGILIPATAQVARRLTWAEAAAVGPLVRSVAAGDQVLFLLEDAFMVEVQGDEYMILRERDLHAVASPRNEPQGTGLYL